MDDRSIQRLMAAEGTYTGAIDGDFGPKSQAAVGQLLLVHKPEAMSWSAKRQKIAAAQIILDASGYEPGEVDGYAGHNTEEAFNAWEQEVSRGAPEILPGREPSPGLDQPKPSQARWPSQSGVRAFFGEAGSGRCTAGIVNLPMPFRIAWNKAQKVKTFRCHELVAEPLTTIFREAVAHYGEAEFSRLGLDLFGGCYNYRAMRGGSSLSMHAYGIAVDLDPENNQLRWGRDRATFARPDYNAWWEIVEATGGISLGRLRNYDWMHFQFATL